MFSTQAPSCLQGQPALKSITVAFGDKSKTFYGRPAWALGQLILAGFGGCTPITHPGPRWSDYVFKLRRGGLDIETVHETHGGAYAMDQVRSYMRSTGRVPSAVSASPAVHRLYAFIAMFANVYERLSPKGQKKMSGRLRGGLTDDVGISGLVFELQTAAHLLLQGVDLTWHDLEGDGGFDLLGRKDGLEVEIECKAFSGDIGRKIHLRRLYQFGGGPVNAAMIKALDARGPAYVDVQITDRLVGRAIGDAADRLRQCLDAGVDYAGPDPCSISVSTLPMDRAPIVWEHDGPAIDQDAMSDAIQKLFGHRRRNFLITATPKRGAIVIGVASRLPDDVVDGIYHELKGASKQLSGTRPGVVCAHLLDMTPGQLLEVYNAPKRNDAPTALHIMVGRYFENAARQHVHTLRFSVPGSIERESVQDGNILHHHSRESGPSFVLTNNAHRLHSDPRMAAFR